MDAIWGDDVDPNEIGRVVLSIRRVFNMPSALVVGNETVRYRPHRPTFNTITPHKDEPFKETDLVVGLA